MRRIFLTTVFLLGFGVYAFSQIIFPTDGPHVTWGPTNLTYTGYPQAPTASAKRIDGGDIPLIITGQQIIAIGGFITGYVATATAVDGTTLSNNTVVFKILPATVSVNWSTLPLVYNGAPQAPAASVTGLASDILTLSVTGTPTNAGGPYTATAALSPANHNYILNNTTTTFNINRASVPVVWGNTTLTYTGSLIAPTATATGVLSENLPLDVAGAQTNVGGPYTATASLSPVNNNYTLSNTTTPFTIVMPVSNTYTVSWSNTSLTYNGDPQVPTAIATNTLGVTIAVTVAIAQTNVGTYTATAALTVPNPTITLLNTTTPFVITPATVPVVWGNTTLTYTGSSQAPIATATGVKNENLPLNVTGEQTNIGGPYTASAAFVNTNSNYTLSNTTTPFTIVQQPTINYTVTWNNAPLTYNGDPQAPTATATNNQGQSVAVTVKGEQTNTGTNYVATAELTVPDPGITLLNATTRFNIIRATIPVQWGNTTLVYTGSLQVPAATATGVKGEDLLLNIAGSQINVGKGYVATAALRLTNNNYVLSNAATTFEIIQATPNIYTVEWDDTPLTYNSNPQAPDAIATNSAGQNVELIVTGHKKDTGKDYPASAALAVPNSSITLINATTLFDIAPAPLDVAAVGATIVIGQTPVLTYTIKSGQLFGSDALTGALAVTTLNGVPQPPPYTLGEYNIVQGTLAAGSNYTLTFTEGKLTVIDAPIEEVFDIIVNDKSTERRDGKFYGDPAENGEDQALVFVLANPGETIAIDGIRQNPRTVALPKYGDNNYTVTVTTLSGTSQDHTLVIERYYEKVYFEYPDVPTISCNTQTNGGLTFTGFQWYRNGEVIPEATGQYIQVKDNATYHCELTPGAASAKLRTINVRAQALRTADALTAYPNPTQGKVTVQQKVSAAFTPAGDPATQPKIQVFNIYGVLVLQPETNPFDMSLLPEDIYIIKVNGEAVKVIKKN